MAMVNVHPPRSLSGSNREPVAFLWANNNIVGFYSYGLWEKRVSWLPAWLPFNSRLDCSPEAQLECIKRLKEIGEAMERNL
jgi:hypothetical protein